MISEDRCKLLHVLLLYLLLLLLLAKIEELTKQISLLILSIQLLMEHLKILLNKIVGLLWNQRRAKQLWALLLLHSLVLLLLVHGY